MKDLICKNIDFILKLCQKQTPQIAFKFVLYALDQLKNTELTGCMENQKFVVSPRLLSLNLALCTVLGALHYSLQLCLPWFLSSSDSYVDEELKKKRKVNCACLSACLCLCTYRSVCDCVPEYQDYLTGAETLFISKYPIKV